MVSMLEIVALVLEKEKRLFVKSGHMCENHKQIQHFILTRFNLLLWNKDKEGAKVRTTKWLKHRFLLFEKYCLPSIKHQTCQNFKWIVLFDNTTPERYKAKIEKYLNECPQLVPVFVEPERGRYFADIFRNEIVKQLNDDHKDNGNRVLTTYLDNDDALNVRFVEYLRRRVQTLSDETFIYYDEGYQFYTDHKYMMQINYPRNHFVSYVENSNPDTVKSVFGFGGHYYVYTIKGAKIEHVKNLPMWCEVVHEKNMLNDAYFLGATMVKDDNTLRNDFAVDEIVKHGMGIYLCRFLPRYIKTFRRRTVERLFGRK